MDEFSKISHASSVALKYLPCQASNSTGIVSSSECVAAVDRGHKSDAEQFDQELREKQARPGCDENFPGPGSLAHVHGVI